MWSRLPKLNFKYKDIAFNPLCLRLHVILHTMSFICISPPPFFIANLCTWFVVTFIVAMSLPKCNKGNPLRDCKWDDHIKEDHLQFKHWITCGSMRSHYSKFTLFANTICEGHMQTFEIGWNIPGTKPLSTSCNKRKQTPHGWHNIYKAIVYPSLGLILEGISKKLVHIGDYEVK